MKYGQNFQLLTSFLGILDRSWPAGLSMDAVLWMATRHGEFQSGASSSLPASLRSSYGGYPSRLDG
jgi:hypothetical protein